ncbi:hypothetical protein FDO65_02340 [Nakamurella flava]|uniref:Uncharacterized protein n=1 Tax=Nakamurella flava TaxID=2576308 RepID=A0A4U6QJB3_9ACTN|nr:hypothetical protein [Nakamurella flava]TKV60564.1 hypothetical protein FDO65_02340 [Nakamurella flava]
MSRRLEEIHRRLCADQVPCVLVARRDGGHMVRAGMDEAHPVARWAVVISETPGRLWLHQGDERIAVPFGTDETAVTTAVKLRVVHGWAQQGDAAAADALHRARVLVERRQDAPAGTGAMVFDPFALAADTVFRIFESAFRMTWGMTLLLGSPWGVRVGFTVRR